MAINREPAGSGVVEDPRHAEKQYAREPGDLLVSAQADRSGKAKSRKPDVYAGEESDCAIVPMKPPNKEAQASAEVVEGRARTKENTSQSQHEPDTERGRRVPGFRRVCAKRRGRGSRNGSRPAAPSDGRSAAGKLLRLEAERGAGSRRREMVASMRKVWKIGSSI
jgi:hypothetical protein